MSVLNITPRQRMIGALGRLLFLWETDLTVESFEALLRSPDPETRA